MCGARCSCFFMSCCCSCVLFVVGSSVFFFVVVRFCCGLFVVHCSRFVVGRWFLVAKYCRFVVRC